MVNIPKPTPAQQQLNKDIDRAYKQGDDSQLDLLLRRKLLLARQAAGPATPGMAA